MNLNKKITNNFTKIMQLRQMSDSYSRKKKEKTNK